MKTLRHVTFYFILFSLLCVITTKSESAPGGTCQVGDIIQPGESCTYPGTDAVFSVDAAGNALFQSGFVFFRAAGNLNIRNSNINGRRYTLVTEHSEGGGRRITELPGATAPPEQPVDEATPIDPGDDDTILIPDPNLAAAIRQEIGNSITRQTLLNLTRLDARNHGVITDLTGLEHARNLTTLHVKNDYFHSAYFHGKKVHINAIELDLSPIAGLTRLTYLNLPKCGISDVSFLSGLTQLTWLNLGDNSISDISALANLTQLTSLNLVNNNISDISALANLTQLTSLWLSNNNISDISALANLTQLTSLSLWDNAISGISVLANLTQLTSLGLGANAISDISALVKLNLTELDVRRNPLSYLSINTHIPAIQAKRIEVEFDNRIPTTLHKISGIAQQGIVNTALPLPFVAEVHDDENTPFSGVPVRFTLIAGGGQLITTTVTTDAVGQAAARLRMGQTVGTTSVRMTATDISQSVQFTATAVLRSAPVPLPDPNLRAKIAETLGRPLSATLTFADMLKLRTLTANNAGVLDLTGLQYASNLTSLSLNDNSISDVSPLAGLTKLTTLNLRDNWISDVLPLTSLTHLHRLNLQGNPLSDIAIQTHIPRLQAADVNVVFDERTLTQSRPIVRLIYFRDRDRQPQPDINAQMDRLIKDVQQFYADEMERHGYGRKTFEFETDAHRNAIVYHVIGDEASRSEQIDEQFDTSKNIFFNVMDVSAESFGGGTGCGIGGVINLDGHYTGGASVLASSGCFNVVSTAHELGHTFGLGHDFRSDANIMSYGSAPTELSKCAAEWLDVHPVFNTNRSASQELPLIEMLPPSLASPPNAIRLRFKVTDPDGLHQAQLGSVGSVLNCKSLNGKSSTTVEFVTTHLTPKDKSVRLAAIDVNGDFISRDFPVDVPSLLPPIRTKAATTTDNGKYDVNGDGTVDGKDIDALITAIVDGITDAKYDVNGDGTVDINDVVAVNANRDAEDAGAPARLRNLKLSAGAVDRLQEQIDLLIAIGDRSPAAVKTLIYLQQLIATARPEKTQLLANYPNPFNPETWIPYDLAEPVDVTLTIYGVNGQVVRELALGHQAAGIYQSRSRAAYWDGRNAVGEPVASGLYFYTLTAGDFSATRKMLIRK